MDIKTNHYESKTFISNTKSFCNICYDEINAHVFVQGDKVWIEKTCPHHGSARAIIESDIRFHEEFAYLHRTKPVYGKFHTLIIPATFRCNLHCSFCYAPDLGQRDLSVDDIKEAIKLFDGKSIFFSGGEPTTRDDLPQLLSLVRSFDKRICGIVTNGLKLADDGYLKSLIDSGLNYIFFSLDSLRVESYERLKKGFKDKSKELINLKMQALENIKKEKVRTVLSATIYPGINDHEIKDLFLFALANRSFVIEIRFRSAVSIGRCNHIPEFFTSKLIDKFCKQNAINYNLMKDCLTGEDHTIHYVTFFLRGAVVEKVFYPSCIKSGNEWNKLQRVFFIFKLLLRTNPIALLKAIGFKSFFSSQRVRFIHWPTVYNVDLEQIDRGVAHLYGKDKIYNFCKTIILQNKIEPFNASNQAH